MQPPPGVDSPAPTWLVFRRFKRSLPSQFSLPRLPQRRKRMIHFRDRQSPSNLIQYKFAFLSLWVWTQKEALHRPNYLPSLLLTTLRLTSLFTRMLSRFNGSENALSLIQDHYYLLIKLPGWRWLCACLAASFQITTAWCCFLPSDFPCLRTPWCSSSMEW